MAVLKAARIPPLPPIVRRWVGTTPALGVGAAIGLSPWLGKAGTPGSASLLAVAPPVVQDVAVPASAFLMGVIVATVLRLSRERAARKTSPRFFLTLAGYAVFALVLFLGALESSVTRVEYAGGKLPVTYVTRVGTGFGARPAACTRCDGLSNAGCIHALAYPDEINRCFGGDHMQLASAALILAYLNVACAFGALVAVSVLASLPSRHRSHASRRSAARRP